MVTKRLCKLLKEIGIENSIEMTISKSKFEDEDWVILIFRDTTERDVIFKLEDNNKYKDRLLAS
jgi:hypothetical protein